jgi:hypothetical protein
MYAPFCRDFGPICMPIVVEFCEQVAAKIDHPLLQKRPMIFFMGTDAKEVTNTVLLLCAYLIFKEGLSASEAVSCFEGIEDLPIIPFHDATFLRQTYNLSGATLTRFHFLPLIDTQPDETLLEIYHPPIQPAETLLRLFRKIHHPRRLQSMMCSPE